MKTKYFKLCALLGFLVLFHLPSLATAEEDYMADFKEIVNAQMNGQKIDPTKYTSTSNMGKFIRLMAENMAKINAHDDELGGRYLEDVALLKPEDIANKPALEKRIERARKFLNYVDDGLQKNAGLMNEVLLAAESIKPEDQTQRDFIAGFIDSTKKEHAFEKGQKFTKETFTSETEKVIELLVFLRDSKSFQGIVDGQFSFLNDSDIQKFELLSAQIRKVREDRELFLNSTMSDAKVKMDRINQ